MTGGSLPENRLESHQPWEGPICRPLFEGRYGVTQVDVEEFAQNLSGQCACQCPSRLQVRHFFLGQSFDDGPLGGGNGEAQVLL